jgi:hypothetical protein
VRGDPLTNTATLDAGVALGVPDALTASNSKSSNVTPVVRPLTCNAYPAAVGATFVFVAALYSQVVQSKPPYTVTPSSAAPTTTGVVNVPHAYTRFTAGVPVTAAWAIAYAIVPNGCSLLPFPGAVSLPVGDTKIPSPSATTH